jgi:hypothetical protein
MKGFLKGSLVLLAVVAAMLALPSPRAHAADTEGFNILTSPLPIKLVTEPNKTVTAELKLKNQGTKPETIKVGLMKFGATGEIGQPNLFDLTAKDTYAKWVHFEPSQFVAQPGVWITVKMTINVPKEASLGYYLAVTFGRATQAGQKGTNVKGAAATLVLLEVKTLNEKRDLKLLDFSTDHKLYEYLPTTFRVRVKNDGNIYLAPAGNLFIERGGKPVTTIVFNEAGGSVLPASNRQYKVQWKSGFPLYVDRLVNGKPEYDKTGEAKQDLKWDFTKVNKFRFGHYNAKLLLVYFDGKNDIPLEATLGFWVVPWKILLVLLVIFGLVGFGIFTVLRSFFRKARTGTSKLKRRG